ncbi:MAG: cob(I)alamin adenosyltransferase [Candidatus Scalindua rubra]|uniref:corrinoid adenosyltransferase n=1 Tax=Candidatus Scalindua rubra TaxID=1872076 RepID=A0A1E3XG91_9BACT|nr:MAG: cob(I)alamin adenosyltransferase [Candidatus Scalindua rubra]
MILLNLLRKGLIIVYTGNGKGKTTAAMGTALRAVGQGLKVLMLQFIKGSRSYGELESIKKLEPDFKIKPLGKGFIHLNSKLDNEEVIENISKSWKLAKNEILSDKYDMIILDEINYVISYGLLPVEEMLALLERKPERLHVILTGRNAHRKIIQKADLVTEMTEIKHPYSEGVKAQEGIEF